MKKLAMVLGLIGFVSITPLSHAQEITRFAPLKVEELTPQQKALADALAAPPRNGKIANPPFRAYIRSPELAQRLIALADYLRWNTSLPPRLSTLELLTGKLQRL